MPEDAEIMLDPPSGTFDPATRPRKGLSHGLLLWIVGRKERHRRGAIAHTATEGEKFVRATFIALGVSILLWTAIVGAIYFLMA